MQLAPAQHLITVAWPEIIPVFDGPHRFTPTAVDGTLQSF